jgi:hypothetical protein
LLDDTVSVPRPDHARYVIDPSPDFVEVNGQPIPVVQVWVDPKTPHAHRDPALRDWLERLFEQRGAVALARFDSNNAIVLFPPAMTGCGWIEKSGTNTAEHSTAQIFETLRPLRRGN